MIVTTIKGFTNVLGEPKDWDRQANGEVFGLPVKIEPQGDTISVTSAWKPTADEMAALHKGAPIHLRVIGGQPPVSVYVEGLPENLDPDFSEADARRVLLLSKALHLCQSQFEAYASLHAAKHTPDGDEKAATNRRIAALCADALESAGSSDESYVDAFYDLAKMMGIGARAQSPAEVWRTRMRPRLAALLAPASVVGGADRVGLVNGSLDSGDAGVVVDLDQSATRTACRFEKADLAVGDADDLAASGTVSLHGDVVEIGASHGEIVSDAAESGQAERAPRIVAAPAAIVSLAEALPAEINRVRAVQATYKELRNMPNVIVEPQIMMMEHAIQAGIAASAAGDVVAMLRAYEELKGWEE